MIAGQIRTWPKISMISNRMRIESSIEKVRRSLRQHKSPSRSRSSRSEPELFKLSQHLESQDLVNTVIDNGHHSDAGSGDELIFLARRRVSMPDGSFSNMEEKDFFREQNRRRKFMAQFNDSLLDSSTKTNKTSLMFDSDSDSHITPPSSPEV